MEDVPVFKLFRTSSSLIQLKFATLADSLAVLVSLVQRHYHKLPNLHLLSTLDHSPCDTSSGAAIISDIYIFFVFILATHRKVKKESRLGALWREGTGEKALGSQKGMTDEDTESCLVYSCSFIRKKEKWEKRSRRQTGDRRMDVMWQESKSENWSPRRAGTCKEQPMGARLCKGVCVCVCVCSHGFTPEKERNPTQAVLESTHMQATCKQAHSLGAHRNTCMFYVSATLPLPGRRHYAERREKETKLQV